MKIRDGLARINGDKAEFEMKSRCLDIIADDGNALFSISLEKDGSIDVRTGSVCKHHGKILNDRLIIFPRASNAVFIDRPEYK